MRTHDLTTVEGVLSSLNINPEWPIDRREQALKLECANYNALVEIASALNCDGPTSTERVSEIVSAVWALKHKSSEVAAVARHDGGLAEELKAKIASNVAEAAARDMRIADLERDLACKNDAIKTAIGALTRICEVIGAPAPVCPDDAVEQVKTLLCESEGHNARADRAEATLAEMVKALSDHGAPRHYDDPSTPTKRGAQLSLVERLRVTLSIHHWKASAAERRAHEAEESREALLEERRFARDALLDMGSPCRADGFDLDLAARIRALPR